MNRRVFVFATTAAACAPRAGTAQALAPSDAIARLFTAPPIQAAWFTQLFLASVPVAEVKALVASLIDTLGPYQGVAANGKGYTVTFARGTVQADIELDANGSIAGLLFSRMQSPAAADRVSTLFVTTPVPAAWFSDRMLAQVPIEKIRAVTAAIEAQYGPFKSAAASADGTYTVTFDHGTVAILIFLGPDGKIEGLIAQPH